MTNLLPPEIDITKVLPLTSVHYKKLRIFKNYRAFQNAVFTKDTNILLHPRILRGDFNNLAIKLWQRFQIYHAPTVKLDASKLKYHANLKSTPEAEKTAARKICSDLKFEEKNKQYERNEAFAYLQAPLSDIGKYQRDENPVDVPHHDIKAWGKELCAYNAIATLFVNPEDTKILDGDYYRLLKNPNILAGKCGDLIRIAAKLEGSNIIPTIHWQPPLQEVPRIFKGAFLKTPGL